MKYDILICIIQSAECGRWKFRHKSLDAEMIGALICNMTDYFELEEDGYRKSKKVYERINGEKCVIEFSLEKGHTASI